MANTPRQTFRLTMHDTALLEALAEKLALDKTAIIRLALRALADKECVDIRKSK